MMNQTQIGIDIIEISRIKQAISRWGERFLLRLYTDAEIDLCQGRVESLAARFAGKEAAIKALSVEGAMIRWRDIEILSDSSRKPLVFLYRQAKKRAQEQGFSRLAISLSHSGDYAIAVVIGIAE